MQKSKILTLAILASLLSTPCAWAAHKKTAPEAGKPAAVQTEKAAPAKTETAAAGTETPAATGEAAAEPLPADAYEAAKIVTGEKTALADSYASLKAPDAPTPPAADWSPPGMPTGGSTSAPQCR